MTIDINEAARWWRALANTAGRDANAPDDVVDDDELTFAEIEAMMRENGGSGRRAIA